MALCVCVYTCPLIRIRKIKTKGKMRDQMEARLSIIACVNVGNKEIKEKLSLMTLIGLSGHLWKNMHYRTI